MTGGEDFISSSFTLKNQVQLIVSIIVQNTFKIRYNKGDIGEGNL